jgi:hypothetical protein
MSARDSEQSFEPLNDEYRCRQQRFSFAAAARRGLPLAGHRFQDKAGARGNHAVSHQRIDVDQHIDKAQKASRAAGAIASSMAQTLLEMRPAFAHRFDLDEQLVTLAIAQAAMGVAVSAPSKATGTLEEECAELNERLNEVVFDAMNELLTK